MGVGALGGSMRVRPIVRSGGDLEGMERGGRGHTSLLPRASRRRVIVLCALAAALSDMDKARRCSETSCGVVTPRRRSLSAPLKHA